MQYLYHKGRFYEYPENWNELTGKQLIKVMSVLHSGVDESVGRLQLMLILLGWSKWKLILICGLHRIGRLDKIVNHKWIPKGLGRYLDNTERIATTAEEITAFLFKENNLTVNALPKYKKLYGPASSFGNVRMGEFCFAEHYYLSWKENGGINYLNLLIATLYRPGKKKQDFSDMRIAYDPNHTPGICKLIDRWPLPLKLAIASWYHGCREEKITANKVVFEYDDGEESASLHGLWSVMRSVAKAGHFGTFDQVANEYVDTILMELHESIVEHERMKEKLESTGKTEE